MCGGRGGAGSSCPLLLLVVRGCDAGGALLLRMCCDAVGLLTRLLLL